MKISLEVDTAHQINEILIRCPQVNEEIQRLLDFLKQKKVPAFLIGHNKGAQHILKPEEIHYFQAARNSVEAFSADGCFQMKEKLYELEEMLADNQFVRISKSVIANLNELKRFEPSFSGTLCVYFTSGEKAYVSRNYVRSIKEALQMNRRDKI